MENCEEWLKCRFWPLCTIVLFLFRLYTFRSSNLLTCAKSYLEFGSFGIDCLRVFYRHLFIRLVLLYLHLKISGILDKWHDEVIAIKMEACINLEELLLCPIQLHCLGIYYLNGIAYKEAVVNLLCEIISGR